MENKIIDVTNPWDCPFLKEDVDSGETWCGYNIELDCEEYIPTNCPLITADYTIRLVKDGAKE